MPKDMLQIISWIINVPCHLVSSVVSRQFVLAQYAWMAKKGEIKFYYIYIYIYIINYNILYILI